jgi:gamma-glutamyltranspeptidase/glutathione hydrolase
MNSAHHVALLAGLLALGVASTRATAQSPNAFGIPTPGTPQPRRGDQCGAGDARAGMARAGPVGSDSTTRHGRDERSARCPAGHDISSAEAIAIDAAVAAGAVLDVTSQNDTGIAEISLL